MTNIYFSIDPEWEAILKYWGEEQLICERCGYYFYEIDNIGAWNCAQHAVSTTSHGVWSCCNKASYIKGCVPADHTTLSISFNETHDQKIPKPLKDAVEIYDKSVVTETSDEMEYQAVIIVRRFDWITAAKFGRLYVTPATRVVKVLDEKRWILTEEFKKQQWLQK